MWLQKKGIKLQFYQEEDSVVTTMNWDAFQSRVRVRAQLGQGAGQGEEYRRGSTARHAASHRRCATR